MSVKLPIDDFLPGIGETVRSNPVTIVVAETGSGKSTRLPPYLAFELGYHVTVTEPRRLVARTITERVAEEVGTEVGALVGYQTAEESVVSPKTQLVYCTDGLQALRELGSRPSDDSVLVIDEVHEWNLNIELLVAAIKLQLKQGSRRRYVLMSATLEADRLSKFFGNAPVVSVPGRLYPVEWRVAKGPQHEETHALVRQGRSVLAFVPGKAEIDRFIMELELLGTHELADIFPLHGELSRADQQRAFGTGRQKVIVATNVAQTGVTVPGINAVSDSGLEKRTEVRVGDRLPTEDELREGRGVEGLHIGDISRADMEQRGGRAGRTEPGIHVDCSGKSPEERPAFPIPEIMRRRLDQLVLRVAAAGLDATEMEFFHQPLHSALVDAKQALHNLGAIDASGKVTKTGKAMSRLPVNVRYARMIVEAQQRGVLDAMLSIVACMEAGGIRLKYRDNDRHSRLVPRWRLKLTQEGNSDLLAELDCYLAAEGMTIKQLHEHDLHGKRLREARQLRQKLAKELKVSFEPTGKDNRTEVLKASVAGMVDHLYRNGTNGSGVYREFDRGSVVDGAEWVTAQPFDLTFTKLTRFEGEIRQTLNLLTWITRVDPAWLMDIAPHLVTQELGDPYYSVEQRRVIATKYTMFNGVVVRREYEPASPSPEATEALAMAMIEGAVVYNGRQRNLDMLERAERALGYYPETYARPKGKLLRWFIERLGDVCEADHLNQLDLRVELADLLPQEVLDKLPAHLVPEELPADHAVQVDGIELGVSYRRNSFTGAIRARWYVRLEDVSRLQGLPALPGGFPVESIEVVDQQDQVLFSEYSLETARETAALQLAEAERQRRRQQLLEHIEQRRAQGRELSARGRSTDELFKILEEAQLKYYLGRMEDIEAAQGILCRAEVELERLVGADPRVLLLQDMVAGRVNHEDLHHNGQVLAALHQLVLRCRDREFVDMIGEMLDPDKQYAFYDQRVGEDAIFADHLQGINLRMDLEDYAPAAVVAELDLLPGTVQDPDDPEQTYSIIYDTEEVQGRKALTAKVQLPLSKYESIKLPELPLDKPAKRRIPLTVELIVGQEVVARGEPDSEQLKRQLTRHAKRKASRAKRPEPPTVGSHLYGDGYGYGAVGYSADGMSYTSATKGYKE